MKTTKKCFTLIELIVVIAIIGVLAAILVPAMLGYVKKSKIQAANSAASTLLKAANSALEELDEQDFDITSLNGTQTKSALNACSSGNLWTYMKSYSDDVDKTEMAVYIKDGTAIACAAKVGAYYGTAPSVYSNKNYDDNKPANVGAALTSAYNKWTASH